MLLEFHYRCNKLVNGAVELFSKTDSDMAITNLVGPVKLRKVAPFVYRIGDPESVGLARVVESTLHAPFGIAEYLTRSKNAKCELFDSVQP